MLHALVALVIQVVLGTETELLRAWRCYSDFSSLADTATALGARAVAAYWERLDRAIGGRGTTAPARLRTEVRCLGHFFTTLLEELHPSNIGVSPFVWAVVELTVELLINAGRPSVV